MATVNKNFRIKHGLVVEGTTGTINGQNILTETGSDTYILNLIGGETLVKSVASGLSVDGAGELSINRTVVDGWYDAAGAASAAQTAAESYADDAAADAQSAAESYADGLASNYDPAGSAQGAYDNAVAYADGLDTDDIAEGATNQYFTNQRALDATSAAYDAAGAASAAQAGAEDYTDNALESYTLTEDLDATVDGYGYLKSADLSGYATESYVNTAVDNLVDGAPGLLDTLNEIAAAIANDENYATTMTTALAGKQDNLTAGSNIDITNDVISVTGLDSADISDFNTAALSATSAAYDAAGAASAAQSAAESYADGLAGNYDAAGAASAAQSAAEGYADGLVDDLLDATTPFTEINVNDQAKQIAATASINTGSASTVYQWAKADYRSAKLLVKIDNGTHNEVSEILVTLDSSDNVAITEYAIVGTNGSRGTINAVVAGLNVTVTVNPTNNSTVKVTGTLLK